MTIVQFSSLFLCTGLNSAIKERKFIWCPCFVILVEIINGQILSKVGGELEDKWNAWTPSPYVMNISENYSKLTLYEGPNQAELLCLAHVPLRPLTSCIPLSAISSQEGSIDGSHVSFLAAVRHVSS